MIGESKTVFLTLQLFINSLPQKIAVILHNKI